MLDSCAVPSVCGVVRTEAKQDGKYVGIFWKYFITINLITIASGKNINYIFKVVGLYFMYSKMVYLRPTVIIIISLKS